MWIARGNTKHFTISFSLSAVTETTHFVAREEELSVIRKKLNGHLGRRTIIIHGLGGMGKTQLTIEYMKRHRKDYSALLWLNARDETSLSQSFTEAARRILEEHPSVSYIQDALNAPSGKDGGAASLAVKRWLNEPRNNQWLLVYDNYDHPEFGRNTKSALVQDNVSSGGTVQEADDLVPEGYDIRQYLPDTYHGAVIVTTRSSIVRIGALLQLRKLQKVQDSLHILESTSNRQNTKDGISPPFKNS